MVSKPHFDFEHSKLFTNLPIIFMMAPLFLAIVLPVAATYKSVLMIIGIVAALPSMIVLEAYAKVAASENIVLKARIMPWGLEKEFHSEKPVGRLNSTYKAETDTYVTQWKLAYTHVLPEIGEFDNIEIEHSEPWEERNTARKGWAHWKGIEVRTSNIVLVELWLQPNLVKIDRLGAIVCFWMRSGSEDCMRFMELYKGDYNSALMGQLEEEMQRH